MDTLLSTGLGNLGILSLYACEFLSLFVWFQITDPLICESYLRMYLYFINACEDAE